MPTCTSAARDRARRLGAAHVQMRLHRLDHLGVDPQDRIEGHHRVLEDHRDLRAADRAQALGCGGGQLLAIEPDRAALDDAAWRIDQAQDGKAGDGLARPGFAHQAQDLARRDLEIDTVDRLGDAFLGEEMRAQVADAERRAHRRFRGLSTSRRWSPARLMPMIAMASATPGKKLIQ
jgi:hypothetical protein